MKREGEKCLFNVYSLYSAVIWGCRDQSCPDLISRAGLKESVQPKAETVCGARLAQT